MKNYITYNKFIRNIIFLSIIFITLFFLLYSKFIHESSIEKSIKEDTNTMSELVFQNLYTVMKIGGDKELIDETINRIKKDIPHLNVSVVKNDNEKQIITKAFQTKQPQISQENQTIEFATPILFKQECLRCHDTAQVDDVAGVILIDHQILDIKLSLREIFVMLFVLFIIMITVFFSSWFYFLKKYFIKPIDSLVYQISKYKTHKDLEDNITIDTKIKEIKLLKDAFNLKNKALLNSYQKLEESNFTDSLTGIYNRKKFDEYSTFIFNDAQRYNHTFSIVVLDLNKFKPINDIYGHNIGDKVLVFFAELLTNSIRETDYLFRVGGDEFYLLLNNTNLEEATIVVKKLEEKILKSKFIYENIEIIISASFGVSQYKIDANNIEELIVKADAKMYENKKRFDFE